MKRPYALSKNDDKSQLRKWLSNARRVVVAGVGSQLRKDDFVGVQIVQNLRDKVSESVYLIECETVPETFIEPIVEFKPTHVLIIDAALLELEPGSFRLLKPEKTAGPAVSTHALPLQIFCEYLAETTEAEIRLLVIQPKDTSFGEGLTEELKETASQLTDLLSEILP